MSFLLLCPHYEGGVCHREGAEMQVKETRGPGRLGQGCGQMCPLWSAHAGSPSTMFPRAAQPPGPGKEQQKQVVLGSPFTRSW